MAYSSIAKPTDYFNTLLYTGTGSGGSDRQLTGVGFQPDWTWIKNRNSAQEHVLVDAVRGATKSLDSSSTTAEETNDTRVGAFISDGFQLGSGSLQNRVNGNGNGLVAWNWLGANGTASNSNGGINSTVSVNNTAGFSIVKYGTGTGSATTVGHGLNAKPNFIIVKPLGTITTGGWIVGGDNIDSTYNNVLNLDESSAKANDPSFNDTAPTSSVFSVGNNNTNRSGENYIAYCFVEKKGYSKFGSYTGNGSTDGPFVYTGFKPAWVMTKRTDGTSDWAMMDNKRPNEFNVVQNYLKAQASDTEQTDDSFNIDILSNGWKARYNNGNYNASGGSYIYMAFAENPFVANDSGTAVPVTAR